MIHYKDQILHQNEVANNLEIKLEASQVATSFNEYTILKAAAEEWLNESQHAPDDYNLGRHSSLRNLINSLGLYHKFSAAIKLAMESKPYE